MKEPSLELRISEPTRFDRALTDALRVTHPGLGRKRIKEWLAEVGAGDGKGTHLEIETSEGRHLRINAAFPLSPGHYRVALSLLAPLLEKVGTDPGLAIPDPRGCFLPILWESQDLLVLHKASSVPTLPLSASETGTVVNAALAHVPGLAQVGKGGLEPGLLHRLDTGTSGCLAFAKTAQAFTQWRERWKTGDVRKVYRARVSAHPSRAPMNLERGQSIDFPLTADPGSKKRMRTYSRELAAQGARPLEARTEVLEVRALSPGSLDVTVRITTGVRHQIRCHLASMGWPIDGDTIYRGREAPRLFLHAWQLTLPGEQLIEAPLPPDWLD